MSGERIRSDSRLRHPNLRTAIGIDAAYTASEMDKPCQARALTNKRCKYHGGLSTGPRTPAGKAVLFGEPEAVSEHLKGVTSSCTRRYKAIKQHVCG